MRISISRAPITFSNRNNSKFGSDDRATNRSRNFFGALYTKTNMRWSITNTNERFESCALSSARLFLDWHNLHDFVFEIWKKFVDDLVFFDRKREQIDVFEALDFPALTINQNTAIIFFWTILSPEEFCGKSNHKNGLI